MNKVVTITIGGNAFDLEEGAYDALHAYLDEARRSLVDNPDQEEIIGDLEQAVAQKCTAYLTGGKTVVSAVDMAQILNEMGPVSSASGNDSEDEEKKEQPPTYKRLYRLREGRMLLGICSGLAAYFNVDVVLIRILFALAALLTSGGFCIVYAVMFFIIPEADTPQERAAAYGTAPVTAQQLIDRAKEGYEQFKNSGEWQRWSRQMRQEARQWKHQFKQQQREWKQQARYRYDYNKGYRNPSWPPSPIAETIQAVFGILWIVFIVFCAWFLYNHVHIVHQFLDVLWAWWTNLLYSLVQMTSHH